MILNLTQHPATPDQVADGVVDLTGDALLALKDALTFNHLPTIGEIRDRADWIAALASDYITKKGLRPDVGRPEAMIGGAPFLMAPLERALLNRKIDPVYAFSQREVVEQIDDQGQVSKKSVFRHLGFITLYRQCQCGSGLDWAQCSENSPYCG